MKVFLASYNIVNQNESGGVQVRIKNFYNHIAKMVDVKLFDMWNDRIDDCDLVHIFKANIDTYSLMIQAKNKGKKIILSSVVPQSKPWIVLFNLLVSKAFRLHTGYYIIKKELELADAIIAQTEKEKNFICKYYRVNKEKVFVIPNGISVNFSEENRKALASKIDLNQKYLLQVGRFDNNKNQLSVIKALKNTDIPVVFIGGEDPQYRNYYERCKNEAGSNVVFLGWIENGSPELQSAYMNAHAVILPSHKEIFGNSLIEAGAAGCVLIGTNALPIDLMGIGDYCLSINPKSIKDIKNKITKAWSLEKKANQSLVFHSLFSWEAVAKRHYEIYKKVLNDD